MIKNNGIEYLFKNNEILRWVILVPGVILVYVIATFFGKLAGYWSYNFVLTEPIQKGDVTWFLINFGAAAIGTYYACKTGEYLAFRWKNIVLFVLSIIFILISFTMIVLVIINWNKWEFFDSLNYIIVYIGTIIISCILILEAIGNRVS